MIRKGQVTGADNHKISSSPSSLNSLLKPQLECSLPVTFFNHYCNRARFTLPKEKGGTD